MESLSIVSAYDEPLYYEIAFSFIDAKRQADLFLEFAQRYSTIEVKRFLDIGCGPSLQLRELAARGYEAIGLDSNPRMLQHLVQATASSGHRVETLCADMTDFRLDKPADFAFCMMGTIGLIESNRAFLSHLSSVAASLNPGGLYIIENMRLDWAGKRLLEPQSWTMEREGIKVETTYSVSLDDALKQTIKEELTLNVDDHGRRLVLKDSALTKIVFPQEFLLLVELEGSFEFVGWFERDSTKRLEQARMDNIALLRRKQTPKHGQESI